MYDKIIRAIVLISLFILIPLNGYLAHLVSKKLTVQPKDVLSKLIDNQNELMSRLDDISEKHKQYMQDLVEAAKQNE